MLLLLEGVSDVFVVEDGHPDQHHRVEGVAMAAAMEMCGRGRGREEGGADKCLDVITRLSKWSLAVFTNVRPRAPQWLRAHVWCHCCVQVYVHSACVYVLFCAQGDVASVALAQPALSAPPSLHPTLKANVQVPLGTLLTVATRGTPEESVNLRINRLASNSKRHKHLLQKFSENQSRRTATGETDQSP